jgi:hypothetical protein
VLLFWEDDGVVFCKEYFTHLVNFVSLLPLANDQLEKARKYLVCVAYIHTILNF